MELSPTDAGPVHPDPKASTSAINRLLNKANAEGSEAASKQLEQAANIVNRQGSDGQKLMGSRDDKLSDACRETSVFQNAKGKLLEFTAMARDGAKEAAIMGLTAANPVAGRAAAVADKMGAFDQGILDKKLDKALEKHHQEQAEQSQDHSDSDDMDLDSPRP